MKSSFIKNKTFLHILIVVGVVFLIYGNTLSNGLLQYDDYDDVVTSKLTHNLSDAIKILEPKTITYAVIIKYFGENPALFHANSVILQAINCVLVYFITRQIFNTKKLKKAQLLSLFVALIYAVNPIVGESVNWIAGSIYLYFGFYVYTTLLLFLKYRETKRIVYLGLTYVSITFSVIAIRSPWLLVIPLILFGVDFLLYNLPQGIKIHMPYFLLTAVYLFVLFPKQVDVRIGLLDAERVVSDSIPRPLQIGKNLKESSFAAFNPFNVSVVHDSVKKIPVVFFFYYSFYLTIPLLLHFLYKKDKFMFGMTVLYFVAVAPMFSPIKIAVDYAERYFYVATLFSTILTVYVISKIKDSKLVPTILCLIVFIFSLRSFIRTFDWRDDTSLWKSAAASTKDSYKVYMQLGIFAHKNNDIQLALKYYDAAVELRSDDPILLYNIGLTYLKAGVLDEAIEYFTKAKTLNPEFPEAYYRLGQIYLFSGDIDSGVSNLKKALELRPDFKEALLELNKVSIN